MMYAPRWHTVGRWLASLGTLASGLAGCSMHPLPEDVSRASTFDIVERIRCEAQAGSDRYRTEREAQNIVDKTTNGLDSQYHRAEYNNAGTVEKPRTLNFMDKKAANLPGFQLDLTGAAERKRQNARRFLIVEDLS